MQQPNDPVAGKPPAASAFQQTSIGWPTLIAVGLVCVGWFVLDAVSLRVGHFISGFRFFELAALIARPTRLVTGVRDSDLLLTIPFVLLCVAAIAVALAPRYVASPRARLGLFAPLALMILCGAILYDQAATDAFSASSDSGDIGRALANLGNVFARRTGAALTDHLSLDAGGWVSTIGAMYLAYSGARRKR